MGPIDGVIICTHNNVTGAILYRVSTCGGLIVLSNEDSTLSPTLHETLSNISHDKLEMPEEIMEEMHDHDKRIHADNNNSFQRKEIKHAKRSRTKHKKPHMTRRVM